MKKIQPLIILFLLFLFCASCRAEEPESSFAERQFSEYLPEATEEALAAETTTSSVTSDTTTETASETTAETETTAILSESLPAVPDLNPLKSIPPYQDMIFCEINHNIPYFTEQDLTASSFEFYSPLDELGRCGVCFACIGADLMPTEPRGSIGMVKPSGWKLTRYDGIVEGNYLFNRCHLIGYQLTGQNANINNLITGTRYFNTKGMQPFENQIAEYIRRTGYHVLYRVTPVFSGDNLLADGVLMEAWSVEDNGRGICFNVFCYNVQPGIIIDYTSSESRIEDQAAPSETGVTFTQPPATVPDELQSQPDSSSVSEAYYILNTNTNRFHRADCDSVRDIKEKNKSDYCGRREELIACGFVPCQRCKP